MVGSDVLKLRNRKYLLSLAVLHDSEHGYASPVERVKQGDGNNKSSAVAAMDILQQNCGADYKQSQSDDTDYHIAIAVLLIFSGRVVDLQHVLWRSEQGIEHRGGGDKKVVISFNIIMLAREMSEASQVAEDHCYSKPCEDNSHDGAVFNQFFHSMWF